MEHKINTKLADATVEEWDNLQRQYPASEWDRTKVQSQVEGNRIKKRKAEEYVRNLKHQTEEWKKTMLCEEVKNKTTKRESITADKIMEQGVSEMKSRASTYDAEGGERSMSKTVDMFNALTSGKMSEEQGWKFMCCLKLVRSEQGDYRDDSYIDGAAYFALAGETASNTR